MIKQHRKCRHGSPRLLDRLAMWLGFKNDLHCWKEQQKIYGQTIYYCRTCECGAEQVKSAGPTGDGKWRDVSDSWLWKWEKEQFEKAKPYTEEDR